MEDRLIGADINRARQALLTVYSHGLDDSPHPLGHGGPSVIVLCDFFGWRESLGDCQEHSQILGLSNDFFSRFYASASIEPCQLTMIRHNRI